MVYYLLPHAEQVGRVKVAYQLTDILRELGVRMAVASPQGEAASWFHSSAPVVDREKALKELSASDVLFYSFAQDMDVAKALPARKIFHAAGNDPQTSRAVDDPGVTLLSANNRATRFLAGQSTRVPIEIGTAVSDTFFFDGSAKRFSAVSYMQRRGVETAIAGCHANPGLTPHPIHQLPHETGVASQLKRSSFFLAPAPRKGLGLPILEAMAAGCVVLATPSTDTETCLVHEKNCVLCAPEEMPERLRWLVQPMQQDLVARLRDQGLATAYRFTLSQYRQKIAELMEGPLSFLRS